MRVSQHSLRVDKREVDQIVNDDHIETKFDDEHSTSIHFSDLEPEPKPIESTKSAEVRRETFQKKLHGFLSPFFMAFHWRLLSVLLSLVATFIAVPTMTVALNSQTRFLFLIQFFIRFLVLSSACWLIIYVAVMVGGAGAYGRFSTIGMMDKVMKDSVRHDCKLCRCVSSRFLRLFCLMDDLGIEDMNTCWMGYKMVACTLLVVVGCALMAGYCLYGDGLLLFAGLSLFGQNTINIKPQIC